MPRLLDQLHEDHKHIAQLLDVLDREMARADQGGAPDFELMADIMSYMTRYPDVFHHPHEELIFAAVDARDPELIMAIAETEKEHAELAERGKALLDSLRLIEAENWVRRDQLEAELRGYVDLQRGHMDREEGTVFPRLRERLSDREWREIESRADAVEDPVFGAARKAEFDRLFEYLERSSG